MFDDHGSDSPGNRSVADHLRRGQWRVYDHVREHGPIARTSLQADVFPRDPRTFDRLLASLTREGYLRVCGGRVTLGVDLEGLAAPRTAEVPGLDASLTLRPATRSDLSELLEVAHALVGEELPRHALERVHRLVSADRIHERRPGDWRVVLVAELDGTIEGWAHLSGDDDGRTHAAELGGGVARDVRRNGVGSRLHRYALECARARECPLVSQRVPADDADTVQFLRTRGWSVEGAHPPEDSGTDGDRLRLVHHFGGVP